MTLPAVLVAIPFGAWGAWYIPCVVLGMVLSCLHLYLVFCGLLPDCMKWEEMPMTCTAYETLFWWAEVVLSCIGMSIIPEMSGFVPLPTPSDFLWSLLIECLFLFDMQIHYRLRLRSILRSNKCFVYVMSNLWGGFLTGSGSKITSWETEVMQLVLLCQSNDT